MHVVVDDAREWLQLARGDLVLTDPPHLDNFPSRYEHSLFIREWHHLALAAAPVVIHSCGASPAELKNYLDLTVQPWQILIWPHHPWGRFYTRPFSPAHHYYLLYGEDIVMPKKDYWTVMDYSKPSPFYNVLIEQLCPEQGTVLDPFCGRGEIPHAARETGRLWEGCDINPNSVADAVTMGL